MQVKSGEIVIAIIIILLSVLSIVGVGNSHVYASLYTDNIPHFNFAAVGDWDCTEDTEETVDNIVSKDPELIAGLGDYSYDSTVDCWLELIDPIDEKMKIAIGNHDDADQILAKLKDYFDLEREYYSFDYENVHFVVLATESDYLDMDTSRAQEQLAFVEADLEKASSNPNVEWIIPFFHHMMYYENEESSLVDEHDDNLRGIYHPLFERYGVNLVLFAHSHTYERTFPIKFNEDDTDNPIVTSKNLNNYDLTNGGLVAVTAGTAGAHFTGDHGDPAYTPIQIEGSHGFLDVQVLVNENKLVGTFYDNNANKKDEFTIQKKP